MQKRLVIGLIFLGAMGAYVFFLTRQHAPPLPIAPYQWALQSSIDTEQEIAFYRKRVQHNPDGFLDLAALADAYLRRARTSGEAAWYLLAEQAAQRSLASFKENPEALLILARVELARHQFQKANTLTQQAETIKPTSLAVLSNYLTLYLATGALKQAVPIAEQLVMRAPSLETYTQRGLVRSAQGDDAGAIRDFSHAIELEQVGQTDASAQARTWLGRIYAKRDQPAWAEALFLEALRIQPKQAVARGLLADLKMRQGRYEDAANDYQLAFDHSQLPIYLMGQARAKAKQNQTAAVTALQQQIETMLHRDLASQSFGHRRDLARFLLERNHIGDAAKALTLMQAESKIRQDAETLNLLAWSLFQAKQWLEAERAIQQALDLGSHDAELLYRISQIKSALGKPVEARKYQQEAEQKDPGFRSDPLFQAFAERTNAK